VNRLTQHIGLVLISSSLVLHGCHRPAMEDKKRVVIAGQQPAEKEKEELQANQPPGSTATGSSGAHHGGYHGGHLFRRGVTAAPLFRSTPSPSAARSSGFSSHPSSAGSVRGGFGGSAHGVSS
jgi:hypothetical protein